MKTEYKVVFANRNYKEFIKDINDSLAEGWKCQGGISISYCPSMQGGYECHYAQAMIREIEE